MKWFLEAGCKGVEIFPGSRGRYEVGLILATKGMQSLNRKRSRDGWINMTTIEPNTRSTVERTGKSKTDSIDLDSSSFPGCVEKQGIFEFACSSP